MEVLQYFYFEVSQVNLEMVILLHFLYKACLGISSHPPLLQVEHFGGTFNGAPFASPVPSNFPTPLWMPGFCSAEHIAF